MHLKTFNNEQDLLNKSSARNLNKSNIYGHSEKNNQNLSLLNSSLIHTNRILNMEDAYKGTNKNLNILDNKVSNIQDDNQPTSKYG